MRNTASQMHAQYLEEVIYRLGDMGEDLRKARYIMKDGIFLRQDSYQHNKLCDIIVGYSDYGVVGELKGSRKKRSYAIKQMLSGERLLKEEMSLPTSHGLFIVYNKGVYEVEKISLKSGCTLEEYLVK